MRICLFFFSFSYNLIEILKSIVFVLLYLSLSLTCIYFEFYLVWSHVNMMRRKKMNLLFYERYESIITKEEKKRSSYDNSFFFRLKYLFKDFLHASHYRVFNYSNIFLEEQKGKREREKKKDLLH